MHCATGKYTIRIDSNSEITTTVSACYCDGVSVGFDILSEKIRNLIKNRDTKIFDVLDVFVNFGKEIKAYHNLIDHDPGTGPYNNFDDLFYYEHWAHDHTQKDRDEFKEMLKNASQCPISWGNDNFSTQEYAKYMLSEIEKWELRVKEEKRKSEERKRKKAERDAKPACVYLIQGNGLFKIGKTRNLKSRLSSLRTSSPVPLEVIHTIDRTHGESSQLEKELHEHFASKRANGEWFELDQNDIDYIKAI